MLQIAACKLESTSTANNVQLSSSDIIGEGTATAAMKAANQASLDWHPHVVFWQQLCCGTLSSLRTKTTCRPDVQIWRAAYSALCAPQHCDNEWHETLHACMRSSPNLQPRTVRSQAQLAARAVASCAHDV